ncbi:helix-turn-helix domain-containing protein [Paenibacillus silagei]|uniref:Transcriptional regulator with XRE-family HTH domain n=1 Tax=Paenibacillus silagei TaxID=1670801 RepID=A0ABS4NQP8_9BACL|nr:helix-turn-helix transcriptional regulator [Paenibacillus silagei]MBP2111642.1 transcriptional regulator with XRE-family HTH domain [Paenibacillus silagei]
MKVAKQVGDQVRHYRNLKGLTQEQLAELVDTYGTYIGRLERGEQNVQLETLEKIADALQISVYALFNHSQFDHLNNQEWIWRVVHLLQEQSTDEQEKAYRVLSEMFKKTLK